MGIFDFIGGLFSPATKLIDNLHTSEEERLALRNEFAKIQSDVMTKMVDLEKATLEAQTKVQVAESQSKYAIVALWRPLTSISLVILIILGSFGLIPLNPEIYSLAKVFLGLYVGGRSAEKFGAALKLGK